MIKAKILDIEEGCAFEEDSEFRSEIVICIDKDFKLTIWDNENRIKREDRGIYKNLKIGVMVLSEDLIISDESKIRLNPQDENNRYYSGVARISNCQKQGLINLISLDFGIFETKLYLGPNSFEKGQYVYFKNVIFFIDDLIIKEPSEEIIESADTISEELCNLAYIIKIKQPIDISKIFGKKDRDYIDYLVGYYRNYKKKFFLNLRFINSQVREKLITEDEIVAFWNKAKPENKRFLLANLMECTYIPKYLFNRMSEKIQVSPETLFDWKKIDFSFDFSLDKYFLLKNSPFKSDLNIIYWCIFDCIAKGKFKEYFYILKDSRLDKEFKPLISSLLRLITDKEDCMQKYLDILYLLILDEDFDAGLYLRKIRKNKFEYQKYTDVPVKGLKDAVSRLAIQSLEKELQNPRFNFKRPKILPLVYLKDMSEKEEEEFIDNVQWLQKHLHGVIVIETPFVKFEDEEDQKKIGLKIHKKELIGWYFHLLYQLDCARKDILPEGWYA
jgi:hypothetical protein